MKGRGDVYANINNNTASQFVNRQLHTTEQNKANISEHLSSGYRINRSADDAAGLSVSEKMRWQIRGLNKASDNIQSGISLIQVADGELNETHSILQRMRELAVQAANDTNTKQDRISDLANQTTYNTKHLLDGSYDKFQIATDGNGNSIDVTTTDATLQMLGIAEQCAGSCV